jgi:type IV pilus assembly protein PilY1
LSAADPVELVQFLRDIISDIAARVGSGAAVSVNAEELDAGSVVYQSVYNTDDWSGDVKAFPIDPSTGEVQRDNPKWSAEEQLYNLDWNNGRMIATFDGSNGIPFRYSNLAAAGMDDLLDSNPTEAENMVAYLRGDSSLELKNRDTNPSAFFRNRNLTLSDGISQRDFKLGDIVHSAPIFQSFTHAGTEYGMVYAGGNDGMLHAFDADTGIERFAYIPRLVFANLKELTDPGYDHLFYVDLTPFIQTTSVLADSDTIDNDLDGTTDETGETDTKTILVGGLGKGGRGYYALDVSDPRAVTDGLTEAQMAPQLAMWEYPASQLLITDATNASPILVTTDSNHGLSTNDFVDITGVEGNTAANGRWKVAVVTATTFQLKFADDSASSGNGAYTGGGEVSIDPDMGYSYSRAFIVNSSIGWVVIFGNGYNSPNENAVLYVLDARTGTLLKKIDTQVGTRGAGSGPVGNCNGLATPSLIDANNDFRVDYAYAGDLNGNVWKFDLRGASVNDWKVAYSDSGVPKPVFQALDASGNPQPITAMPDISRHCDPTKPGFFVIFGTGRYLGPQDFSDQSQQTIYGIWDFGDNEDDNEHIGSFNRGQAQPLSNLTPGAGTSSLQQQKLLGPAIPVGGRLLRIFTDEEVEYITEADQTDPAFQDPDPSRSEDNEVGWYFDMPDRKERLIRDPLIRSGKVIAITNLPNTSACIAGGESFLMEMDACTGGRTDDPIFDINEDQVIDEDDLIKIENPEWADATEEERAAGGIEQYIYVAPTAIWYPTMIFTPSILALESEEIKLMSTAAGGIINLLEKGERKGIYYWKQIGN